MTKEPRPMTEGQRSYEARRAARAGVSLEKWMQMKAREQEAAARVRAEAAPPPPRKPGLIARLIERAHRPL